MERQERSPFVESEFLKFHRSKLELDPCSNRGQPSIRRRSLCQAPYAGHPLPVPDTPAKYDGLRFSSAAGFAYAFPARDNSGKRSLCSCTPGILHGWSLRNSMPYSTDIGYSRNIHHMHIHTTAGSLSLPSDAYKGVMVFLHCQRFVCKSMAFCSPHPL